MIELRSHRSIREIPEQDWDALQGVDEAPFLRWAFFDTLEQTGCIKKASGWAAHHLTFYAEGRLIGAAPAYLKANSEGEFVFDHAWANAAARAGMQYFPKLIVAVPFTPATAPRLLFAKDADAALMHKVLAEALRKITEAMEISSAHVLFPPKEQAEALTEAGLILRYGLQFQWKNAGYANYEEFLARFSSKRRNQWRRERKEMQKAGITIDTLIGSDITPEIVDLMYGYYTSTVDKFHWGRRYLTRAFFEEIFKRLPGGIEVVLAREAGRPIAGAFNFIGKNALYGRYWGASEERPFLHFNVCYYHSIDTCIERKLGRFEPGAGGEHKMSRGFEPTITFSAHHIQDENFAKAVRDYLVHEREAIAREAADPEVAFR